MSKAKFKLNIKVPDGRHMEHFETALSIANAYRVQQGKPVMNMENFCLNSIVTGANEVINFYRNEMAKKEAENAQESEQVVEKSEANSEGTSTVSENTNTSGQADE